ncbi:Ger(x)C family spore germination protein [Paenibacillus sp. HWE-109]|uniref:Ger(x)C family spore germination protein n=1 Tax=Paenibacillus sp. HWE-109 TaxID=1306526 RepID=UPI001EDF2FA6|nr:Ger(x)C family spore germination protein [Paenibacillus sp. HWE-109]UKS31194.1 Ger(x)C family spore germination protein [Paenibacillus sp. HWE-109]
MRKFSGILLSLVLMVLLTGCWSSRELNQLAVAVGLGIDKVGDMYKISAQVIVPSSVAESGKPGSATVVLFKSEGKTVLEALGRMTTVAPRKIYLAHVRVLVLGEELAKEGISKPLEMLSRDQESRTDFYIVVAKNSSAENVLKVLTPLEKIPANRLYSSLKTSSELWAPTITVTLDKLIQEMVTEGKTPVLSVIEVVGVKKTDGSRQNAENIDPPSQLRYTGLAYFRKDKLDGWMNEEDSKVYNYMTNHINKTVGIISCPNGGNISLKVIRSKTKLKGIVINGKPQINAEIQAETSIGQVECEIDLVDPSTIDMLEKSAGKQLEKLVLGSVLKVHKRTKLDIYGFGELIHEDNPQAWKDLKNDWDANIATLDVNIKADVKIRRLGTKGNSFLQDVKE